MIQVVQNVRVFHHSMLESSHIHIGPFERIVLLLHSSHLVTVVLLQLVMTAGGPLGVEVRGMDKDPLHDMPVGAAVRHGRAHYLHLKKYRYVIVHNTSSLTSGAAAEMWLGNKLVGHRYPEVGRRKRFRVFASSQIRRQQWGKTQK